MNQIGDYAVIGDCHSLALVGRDGSVDWLCFPRFDSPSVFGRLLDPVKGGHFRIAPHDPNDDGTGASRTSVTRAYVPDTNVLTTTFRTPSGTLELTDAMPVGGEADDPAAVAGAHAVLRRARCIEGRVTVSVELAARFEYSKVIPRVTVPGHGRAYLVGGPDALWVRATHPLEVAPTALAARWDLATGDEAWIEAAWTPSEGARPFGDDDVAAALRKRLDRTVAWWRAWMSRCSYSGIHADVVRRSALVLKALTYAPTGAVIAAGTTSLPEVIGGQRNWDYRFTWIRDATLTLISLLILGFDEEAVAFKGWLERTDGGRPEDLQIMYGIGGERLLPEIELSHLDGHARSRPVRIGNAAADQSQLDSYGQILEAAWLFDKVGGTITAGNWDYLAGLAGIVAREWQRPDHGIWEIRDNPRHFVHSKLNCWMALDRAVRLARAHGLPGDIDMWASERDELHAYLLHEGAPNGWFRQAAGVDAPDASVLFVPALGFLPATHPLVERTVEVVRRDLEQDGLVHRYHEPDGLGGDEGAFLLCSFWLLDCLTHAGRLDEAQALLDRLIGFANDVGIYSEEVDEATGEHLGNTPQAFTHMALVASCSHLSAALDGMIDFDAAHDFSALAAERMLVARPDLLAGSPA